MHGALKLSRVLVWRVSSVLQPAFSGTPTSLFDPEFPAAVETWEFLKKTLIYLFIYPPKLHFYSSVALNKDAPVVLEKWFITFKCCLLPQNGLLHV